MPALARTLSALLLLLPLSARADQFLYVGGDLTPSNNFNFTYLSDTRLAGTVFVTPTTCSVKGQACTSVEFRTRVPAGDFIDADITAIGDGVYAGVDEIDPRFFTAPEVSYYESGFANVYFYDLPDSVPYFYDFSDPDDGKGFTLISPELISSRTTLTSVVCYGLVGLCTNGEMVTIDPVKGEIIGVGGGNVAFDGLHLTGLPASFFQPGYNELPASSESILTTKLIIAGRGGAETVTPEPSSLLLLGSGVSAAAALLRRRRRVSN